MRKIYRVSLPTPVSSFSIVEVSPQEFADLPVALLGDQPAMDHQFHIASDFDLTKPAVTDRDKSMMVLDSDDFQLFELLFTDLTANDYEILTNRWTFDSWYTETLNESWIRPIDYH
jgi:hypothetical protein